LQHYRLLSGANDTPLLAGWPDRFRRKLSWQLAMPCRPMFRLKSAVMQLTQQPCGQPSGNTPLHEQITDPVEQWDGVCPGQALFKRSQLARISAASQGINQGVFLGAFKQHLG